MATALAAPKSHNLSHFIGRNYEIALKQSIDALLTSLQDSNSLKSRNFTAEFREFVQSKADPPLESIWVYAALASTCCSTPKTEPLARISAIKDLFQLIVSCSASCNSVKSIALAAPVVYYIHGLALDVGSFKLSGKRERKVRGEIKALINSILGYMNACCNGCDGNYDDLEGLILPLGDLVSFWALDDGVQSNTAESLRVFFPLLSEDIVERADEGCGLIDIAGFVIAEAFLLKLCLKIQEEGFEERTQTELRAWAVGSVTGFRSPYVYVMLVNMLLEPALPTTSLLNPERRTSLRKVLFDAFILVEYSFLNPKSLGQLPEKLAKRVIFTKLMATHLAIELFREHGDHGKAILYSNSYASSNLPSLLLKWVKSEIGTEFSVSKTIGSSPRTFIRWMLDIENKGIKLFEDYMSKFKPAFNSIEEMEQLGTGEERQGPDSNLLFYIDNKGQEEHRTDDDDDDEEKENAGMSAAFMSAARSLQSSGKEGKKRKSKDGEGRSRIKFVKYDAFDDHSSLSRKRSANRRSHYKDSGSEIEDPSSDDDTVD